MIKEIFFKELAILLKSRTIFFLYSTIIILFILSNVLNNIQFHREKEIYQRMTLNNEHQLKNASNNLSTLTFLNQSICLSPSEYSFIMKSSNNLPNIANLSYFNLSTPVYQFSKSKNNYFTNFTTIDWSFIIIFIISLLAIIISYNTFSGEKEDGTLKLMFVSNLPKWKILLGKFLGILVVSILPVIIGIIAGILSSSLFRDIDIVNTMVIIFPFVVQSICFISINILVGMFCSLHFSKSVVSISVSVVIWTFFLFFIPQISILSSKNVINCPTISQIKEDWNKIIQEVFTKYSMNWDDAWIGNPPNDGLFNRVKAFNEFENFQNNTSNNLLNLFHEQYSIYKNISIISPYSVFNSLSEKIADNGTYRLINFENQLKSYHHQFKEFIENTDNADKQSYHVIWMESSLCPHFMSNKSVDIQDIPQMNYKSPTLIYRMFDGRIEIIMLLVLSILLFVGVFFKFVYYDPR